MSLLSSINVPFINYHHSGWITKDKKYLFICDEGAQGSNPDITLWDISDPANPDFISQFIDTTSIIHNLYVIDDYAYTSYYNSGFRIFNITDPASFTIAAEYDPNPTTGDNFGGSFGCFPFTKSGNIFISDQTGLYIFNFSERTTGTGNNFNLPDGFMLHQNYPNPFNPATYFEFLIASASGGGFVTLKIYDILGNEIAVLVNEEKAPGPYSVHFNAAHLSGGIYFYKLTSGKHSVTKKMTLLK